MNDNKYKVVRNEMIAPGTYLMTISGDTSEIKGPGQFINIKLDGLYLRRPMSICSYGDDEMTMIYKIVGKGTKAMSRMQPGEEFDALSPLGNGFMIDEIPECAFLIGGGAGAMPIYTLAQILRDAGKRPHVIIGFNKEKEIFFADEFKELGVDLTIATMDGSSGVKGTVVDALLEVSGAVMDKNGLKTENRQIYACVCGPEPMMKAVAEHSDAGQYDLGARMACGFGACMGCTVITKNGPKRVCKDGPIFRQEEIIW